MKKINLIKISLDILMAVVFALLFNKMVIAGLAFHEIAGLAIGFAFIIHMVLNWRWIKQVTLNIYVKTISIKTKIGYIVDVLLLFSMGYIIVSGVLVSKFLFPTLRFGNQSFLKSTHISVSYITLLLLGIHVGLHWNWVMNTFKRIFRITEKIKVSGYIAKAAVILVLAFSIYNVYSTNYFTRPTMVGNIFGVPEVSRPDKGFNRTPDQGVKPNMENRGSGREQTKSPNIQEGERRFPPGGKGFPSGERGFVNPNALNVLGSNLGIIAVFTIITYYIEKLLTRKRISRKVN